jgi:two-component system, chemotaxis family, CheB/CheR fusion protein
MKVYKNSGKATKNVKKRATLKSTSQPFPIVAIGASAGGLEAVTALLKALPPRTGMAYVYIQHLDPSHESMLTDILARHTKMKVLQAKHRLPIKKNHFFIIPPNTNMAIIDGVLILQPREAKPSIHMPIDKFFLSLADNQKEGAIGIVLSGNASDGTIGLQAIKAAGGITIAQDDSAKFQSMPKSAISEGVVDLVMSPEKIAAELTRISSKGLFSQIFSNEEDASVPTEDFNTIIELLRKSTGVDFNHYKVNTIQRRILRRVLLLKFDALKDYLKYLKQHADEIHSLYRDLLINVTSFFRDPDSLEYLKKSILPKLIKSKKGNEQVRIWVPACSTGEEAYSLAMILTEIIGENLASGSIQIFASDLSDSAISKARIGLYSKNDLDGVSPKRLQRFFTKVDGSYRVVKAIRDLCVFAPHNVLRDPPFSKLDLISCCNLMIYLDTTLQQKILHTFHYALNDGGYLVLGKSETISSAALLFNQLERKYKVYGKKKEAANKARFELKFPVPARDESAKLKQGKLLKQSHSKVNELERAVDLMMQKRSPSSVVINEDCDIVQFRGSTSLFLEPASGKASFNLLKMARSGLSFELRNAIHKCSKSGIAVRKSGIEIKVKGHLHLVSIEVEPIRIQSDDKLFLVIFEESFEKSSSETKSTVSERKMVKQLEQELAILKEDMRSLLEEQEAQVEELQSSNEEIVSSNEELQSINEELETSKEEIESANEELTTINQELDSRNNQLSESQDYAESVFGTIREALIVLDEQFRVRNANRAFYRIFNVKEQETEGILFFELGNRQWDILKLRQLLDTVIPSKSSFTDFEVEHDFPGIGHKVMLINGKSIIQQTTNETLILMAIEDITEHRKAEKLIHEREAWFRNMANQSPVMIWVAGTDGERNFFNDTWHEFTGVNASERNNFEWKKQVHRDDLKEYLKLFNHHFEQKTALQIEYRLRRSDNQFRWVIEVAKPTFSEEGSFSGFIGSCTEIHDKKILHDELEQMVLQRTSDLQRLNLELNRSNNELQQFAYVASHDLQEPLRKILTYADRLQKFSDAIPEQARPFVSKIVESSSRMRKLVEELLNFSRTSEKDQQYVMTDLNGILKTVLSDFDLIINEKNAVINAGKLPTLEAVPIQMEQLLHNMVSNALKFSRRGVQPIINISATKLSAEQQQAFDLNGKSPYVEIRFADNGIGFDEAYADQIFDIFQRLNDRGEFPGTGIGLALCRKIISNHKGKVIAEGKENEGATFRIILPSHQEKVE